MPVRMLVPTGGTNAAACLAVFAEYFNTNFGANYRVWPAPASMPPRRSCPVPGDNGVVFTYAGVSLPTAPTACSLAPCAPTITSANPLNGLASQFDWANAYPPNRF